MAESLLGAISKVTHLQESGGRAGERVQSRRQEQDGDPSTQADERTHMAKVPAVGACALLEEANLHVDRVGVLGSGHGVGFAAGDPLRARQTDDGEDLCV